MTREELRDYVEEQRSLNNIPYHVYSELIDGVDTLEQEPICPSHGIDCEDCPAYDPCGDAISRQAVLAKYKEVLQEIRQEIENLTIANVDDDYIRKMAGLYVVKREIIAIIDKHIAEGNYAQ